LCLHHQLTVSNTDWINIVMIWSFPLLCDMVFQDQSTGLWLTYDWRRWWWWWI